MISKLVKVQNCRNGCGQNIVVQLEESSGKWKPYNIGDDGVINGLHDCPNSTWNKQQQQKVGGVVTDAWGGTNKQGQMFQAKVSQDLQQTQAHNEELILKLLTDINRQQSDQNNLLNTWNNSLQEMYNMISAIFQHFGLNEPQPLQAEQVESAEEVDYRENEEHKAAAKEERERNGSEYSF